jgi:thiol-disulfide isomerase/thioredoxin
MKNFNVLKLLALLIMWPALINAQETQTRQGHRIEVNINGLEDTTLILGHYFNQRMYVDDTTQINNMGKAIFEGDDSLPGGIYVMYLPNQRYFDVLIDDNQHFSVSVDTSNFVSTMEINGAEQPLAFNQYQRFIIEKQSAARELQQQLQAAGAESDEGKQIRSKLENINEQVKNYWNKLIDENPGTMLALFLNGIQEVEIPEFDMPQDAGNPDSLLRIKKYQYYKSHYFDNLDVTDNRILRTPFFASKVDTYFSSILPQMPDSLLSEGISLIEKSRPAPKVFRFVVQYLFNYANDSQIMGMDKMMVGLAEKYYLSGEAEWADEEFLEKLGTRVTELKPTLIGNKSHDLKMQAYTGEYHRLHELPASATILVFWETDCGHCKKAIPKLHDLYQKQLINKGVKVFAVYTQGNKPEWTKFIDEHELYDFINVWDPYRETAFRENYDIRSTPTVYVLGENKEIIGKRIAIEDIPPFIDHYLKHGRPNTGIQQTPEE